MKLLIVWKKLGGLPYKKDGGAPIENFEMNPKEAMSGFVGVA